MTGRPADLAQDRPDVTVAVVTYNSSHHLGRLFASLPQAMAGVDCYRVVVVDNQSRDGTQALVRKLAPAALLIELDRNAGYAAGINIAVAAVPPTEAVLVLNPDIVLCENAVAPLLEAVRERRTGIAVPMLVDREGRLVHSLRRDPTVMRALGEALLGGPRAGRFQALGEVITDVRQYQQPREIDWASGTVMMVSRRCLEAVGAWDESYFLYSEETDYALRARDHGFAIRYLPNSVVMHNERESAGSAPLWSLLVVNRVKLFARRHQALRSALFWLVMLASEGLRALLGRPHHREAVKALLLLRHQSRGAVR